jgi:hypothetical protein
MPKTSVKTRKSNRASKEVQDSMRDFVQNCEIKRKAIQDKMLRKGKKTKRSRQGSVTKKPKDKKTKSLLADFKRLKFKLEKEISKPTTKKLKVKKKSKIEKISRSKLRHGHRTG